MAGVRERPPELDALAALSSGPPWILGRRGSPLEAPENTLAGFERALDIGLDGLAYDARATRGGDVVLIADATLERTTNGRGLVAESTLTELSALDAGGAFDARFQGERIPLLEEALALEPAVLERGAPQHVVFVPERGDAARVADGVRALGRRLSVRIASRSRDVCSEVRDLGLSPLWIVDSLTGREHEIVSAEKFAAIGAPASAFAGDELVWPCERWALDADSPADLFSACRKPLHGLTTHEPLRALVARALVRLAPLDDGPWPVQAPELEVTPGSVPSLCADWSGAWETSARVRNPFGFEVRAACGIVPRRGAFEIERVPVAFVLAPGEEVDVPFALRGGSWRTGGDPLFVARLRWRAGPGRKAGALDIDAPILRVRTVRADALSTRLVLLRESPNDPPASMTLHRHRRWLYVAVENPGGLREARAVIQLCGREYTGSRGVRAPLPVDFDTRCAPIPFTCGFVAWRDGERVVRKFAAGIGDEIDGGSPGRIVALSCG